MIRQLVNSQEFLVYLLGLTLSFLLIGFAPSSIFLGCFVFFSVRYSIISKNKIHLNVALLIPILLYCFFCLSFFWTHMENQTIKGLSRTIVFLVIPTVFTVTPAFSKKQVFNVFKIVGFSHVLLALFFLLFAIFRFIKTGNSDVFFYHELVSVLELNAIYVSVFFVFSFFYFLFHFEKKSYRYGILFLLTVLIFLLSSKIIIVSFLLCLILFYAKTLIKKLSRKLLILASLMIVALIYLTSKRVIERFSVEKSTNFQEVLYNDKFNKIYPWTGTSLRLLQLRILKNQIQDDGNLWVGFGLYASRDSLVKHHKAFNTYEGFHTYNYHNQYAQILSELGVVGLAILLIMIIICFKNGFKNKDKLLLIFAILMSFLFITESFLWVQRGLFFYVILYCLFNSYNNYNNDTVLP